jgi:hypothetical protein
MKRECCPAASGTDRTPVVPRPVSSFEAAAGADEVAAAVAAAGVEFDFASPPPLLQAISAAATAAASTACRTDVIYKCLPPQSSTTLLHDPTIRWH